MKNIGDRRRARAMLIGAVLLTAQLGFQDIRGEMREGDRSILDQMRPDQYGTVTQFKKALREAPLLQILGVYRRGEIPAVKQWVQEVRR